MTTGLLFHLGIPEEDRKIFNSRWRDLVDRVNGVMTNAGTDAIDIDNFLLEIDKITSFFEMGLEPDPPFTLDVLLGIVACDIILERRQGCYRPMMEVELSDLGVEFADLWWKKDYAEKRLAERIKALLAK